CHSLRRARFRRRAAARAPRLRAPIETADPRVCDRFWRPTLCAGRRAWFYDARGLLRATIDKPGFVVQVSCADGDETYSSRSARVVSSPAALRAGIQDAVAAIKRNSSAMLRNVAGSVGFTPTNIVVMARVSAKAAINPAAIPTAVNRRPCPTIS